MSEYLIITFWAFGFLIFYTYVGYIIILILLSLVIKRPVKSDENFEPQITFLITAYNEEVDIDRKIENTLLLDYPKEKLEILVASDGSTDHTDEIVKGLSTKNDNIKLVRVEGRVGKTETQNQAVKIAKGDFIIFSDSTTEYEETAIRKIIRNYADPKVGAVSGRYNYRTLKKSPVGIGQVLFWKLENYIKSRQTKIYTVTGCCGCIYSVRKSAYVPLRRDVISDLVQPLKILQKGFRIVFEQEAIAYEETTEKPSEEFRMRVRVITRGMNGILHVKNLLNPIRYPFVSFQLFSHKGLRWLVPIFSVGLFASNLFMLGHWFYLTVFTAQCGFYLLALLGFLSDLIGKKFKLFSIPLYFCIVNLASLVSLFQILKGEKEVVWETVRNS